MYYVYVCSPLTLGRLEQFQIWWYAYYLQSGKEHRGGKGPLGLLGAGMGREEM